MVSHLLIRANALKIPIKDKSVHCVVTSPPYFGLRDYLTAKWIGGRQSCNHQAPSRQGSTGERASRTFTANKPFRGTCGFCGATRVDHQIGLEDTPEQFIARMVDVFREVHRVLRDDGTLWMNMGDSYASGGAIDAREDRSTGAGGMIPRSKKLSSPTPKNLKPKDLIGIPWRLALALQSDGWYLRSEIIWRKPNTMPEAVTDRPTKSHEHVFLLTKSSRYFFDAEAVREPVKQSTLDRDKYTRITTGKDGQYAVAHDHETPSNPSGRNIRTVWDIATESFSGAHFATFPRKLVEPCVKAGTSEKGCCPECGSPWERETEPTEDYAQILESTKNGKDWYQRASGGDKCIGKGSNRQGGISAARQTTGWRPTCDHGHAPVPCLVYDPFAGSGTALVVAEALGRHGVGTDLSAEYLRMAKRRIEHPHTPVQRAKKAEYFPLFPEDAA